MPDKKQNREEHFSLIPLSFSAGTVLVAPHSSSLITAFENLTITDSLCHEGSLQ